jgi:hypothetical protein
VELQENCCKGGWDAAHREGVHIVCLAAQMHELPHVPQLRRRAGRKERSDVRWNLCCILLLLGLQQSTCGVSHSRISDSCCVSTGPRLTAHLLHRGVPREQPDAIYKLTGRTESVEKRLRCCSVVGGLLCSCVGRGGPA